ITAQGTTVITWTYTDENGNESTQTQNVVIEDTTVPVADIVTLADITAQCEVLESDVTAPTATDNCDGVVMVTNDTVFPITAQGTTVITWTYTDENGNYSTQTQNVVIEDTTAPVADVATLADITAQCEVLESDVTAPTATDNCGGIVTVTNDTVFPITAQGTTVITWTYTDEIGNYSTQMQNVVIEDTTAPVADVANLPAITMQCQVLTTDIPVPTATDNCAGALTATTTDPLLYTEVGNYIITWSYDDGNGNITTQTQDVIVTESAINAVTFTSQTLVYNTEEQAITVDNLPEGATVAYAISPDTGLGNAAINTGVYTLTAEVTPAPNAPNCNPIIITATLTIEQAQQEIIFDALPVKNLETDPDFQLTAIATSGLPVYYTYSYTAPNPPATVTADGWVDMLTSGVLQITAHQDGDANYLPATPVTQEQIITSSNSAISIITVGDIVHENPANEIYHLIDCEDTENFVTVSLETDPGAIVTPAHTFTINTTKPGIYEATVTVTSQDGTLTQTYTIVVEKRFSFFDVVVQKFDNLLLANNNPETNGGYSFVAYEWYKNGNLVGNQQYFSEGETINDLLDPDAEYYLKLTTVEGDVLQTCVSNIVLQHVSSMRVYPNPARIGGEVIVDVDFPSFELDDMQIEIYDLNGRIVHTVKSNGKLTSVKLPGTIQEGVYIVICTTENLQKSFKIIVRN
ncbi:T9SS type A sorting domain-containing protein, partial [Flavobacterium rakeshii]